MVALRLVFRLPRINFNRYHDSQTLFSLVAFHRIRRSLVLFHAINQPNESTTYSAYVA